MPTDGNVSETWVSDEDSYFAHLPLGKWATRSTRCGIALGYERYVPLDELTKFAGGKPKCSNCVDGVEVHTG